LQVALSSRIIRVRAFLCHSLAQSADPLPVGKVIP
jgi:hypothetical protein